MSGLVGSVCVHVPVSVSCVSVCMYCADSGRLDVEIERRTAIVSKAFEVAVFNDFPIYPLLHSSKCWVPI